MARRTELPARELLIALLGDYWFHTTSPIPSAALVALLGEFEVGDAGARAALSRLARQGTIEVVKEGRRTAYRVTLRTASASGVRGRSLMRFGSAPQEWDGHWTCVAFSLPDDGPGSRASLRAALRRLGMAPLYDGLWVSPHDVTKQASEVLAQVGARTSTVFRARSFEAHHGREPLDAWDLAGLRRRYERFIGEAQMVADRLGMGAITPVESLVIRTTITAGWRALVHGDPRLPSELLPEDWPISAARALFVEVYDGLGPLAEQRALEVVAPFELRGALAPRCHTVGDLM
jgi:phenylacetic acid degradation operon negative regulatory protein